MIVKETDAPIHGDGIMDWRRDTGTEWGPCANTGDEDRVIEGVWVRYACPKVKAGAVG